MRVLGTFSACKLGDEILEYDRVNADCMLLCHQIMNNLQHRPIERGSMVKDEDIILDPASNAMYIPKGFTGFEPTVLLSAKSTHDGHVLYQRKGLAMIWIAGDLCVILYHVSSDNDVPSLQMHSKLMSIKVYSGLVNARVEDLNKCRTIISFIL